MSFSGNQTDTFLSTILVCDPLDEAVSWVKDNLRVEDVFRDEDIKSYCEGEFEVGDIFNDDKIKEHCELNCCVGDIFTVETLTDWAESNGFVKSHRKQ